MSLKDFVGEFLSFLELQEARLLSWGFYDFSYTLSNVEEMFNEYADENLKKDWNEQQNKGLTMEELLYEMEKAGLLYHPLENEDSYRTRFAEGVRLFARLRQMFKEKDWATGANLVSDIKLHLAPRRYPFRDQTAADCWSDLQSVCWNQSLQKDGFDALTVNSDGKAYKFARFQRDAFARILKNYKGEKLTGTVVSAGTGAGKTKAFYLPALLGIVTELGANLPPFVKIIAIYPRNVLLADQLREALSEALKLSDVLTKHQLRSLRVGALLGSTPKKDDFTRDAGGGKTKAEKLRNWKRVGNGFVVPFVKSPIDPSQDLIWRDEDRERGNTRLFRASGDIITPDIPDKMLALTREDLRQNPPDMLFLSAEMLNRELGNPEWDAVFGINQGNLYPRLLLLDEVHAYEGLHGAQIAWTLRRWRFWSKVQNQHIVGLSATLKNAPNHLGTLVGISPSAIEQYQPSEKELDQKGIEYNLAVKGDPVSGASLLATSIQSAMLVGRLLTPRNAPKTDGNDNEISQSDFYGRKVFGFTDNLDSLNRWYSDTDDADRRKRLARLRLHPANRQPPRTVDAAVLKRVNDAGQFWELPRRLGFNLNNSLNVSRCSSQDSGANAASDIIVASASLEVGFDDPEVGAVLHHKKPVSMSSFIQRKGRAGRRVGMRPLTVVILSDYGGDRWAFQNAEQLFQPEIDKILLPLINPSVLRIQATFFLLEWLARRVKLKGSYFSYFSTPYSNETSDWQKKQISRVIPILKDFLQQGSHWKAFRQDFERVFARPYKSKDGHALNEAELDAILWKSPRPVLRHVVPTLLRQFETEWKLAQSEDKLENAGVNYPLPQFLPSATFAELGGIGVRLTFIDDGDNEKADEYLAVSRALFETCPGRVSKRYALRLQEAGYWHVFSAQTLNFPDSTQTVSVKTLFPNSLFAKEINGVLVYQPAAIELTHRPDDVLDTSNSSWNWESFLEIRGEGITLPIFRGKIWGKLVDGCEAHLHRAYSKVEVTRLARSCEYEIRFESGSSTRGAIFLGSEENKNNQAVGFRLQADGICVRLNHSQTNETIEITPEQISRFRTEFYLDALKGCSLLHEKISGFLIEWMWQTSVAMLAATASQNRCSLAEAQDMLAGVRPQAAAKVLNSIFQVQDIADEHEEEQKMRLKQRIIDQWNDTEVVKRFSELERLLWEDLDEDFSEWVRKRYMATLAQAFRLASVAGVKDVSEDDIDVDVFRNEDGATQIYLTEQNSGGLGQIELIIDYLRQSPEKFLEAMRSAITYCPRQAVFEAVSSTLKTLVIPNPNQAALADSFVRVRTAKSFKQQTEAKNQLQDALESAGLPASRSAVVSLITKLLRPGSSTKTDTAMYLLNRLWQRTEQKLGISIDARVFAYLCSQRAPIRRRMIELLRDIGESQNPSPAQVHSIIGQFLLYDCKDACPECLNNPNRYNNFGTPSRSITRLELTLDAAEVAVNKTSNEWLDQVRQVLRDDGRVRLIVQNDDLSIISKAIQGFLAEEIEVDYLLLPISIASINRHAERWFIDLQLKGVGYGA